MQFHSEEERLEYLERKRRNQQAYRDRRKQKEADEAAGIVASPVDPLAGLAMPIDPASEFNFALWHPDRVANLSEVIASAEALLAALMPDDFEGRRVRLAAERFLAEHRKREKPTPRPMVPAIPAGVSPQAIAEIKAAERAEAARKAAIPTYEDFLANSGLLEK
jgi:hypothetical protein